MDTTNCPGCGALAEVEWRAVMESTDGPIQHAKIRCVQKHWFLLPIAALAAPGESAAKQRLESVGIHVGNSR